MGKDKLKVTNNHSRSSIRERGEEGKSMPTHQNTQENEAGKSKRKGVRVTTIEQLPKWVQKSPKLVKFLLENEGTISDMEPGTARARIIMRDPPEKPVREPQNGRKKEWSPKESLEDIQKNRRGYQETKSD